MNVKNLVSHFSVASAPKFINSGFNLNGENDSILKKNIQAYKINEVGQGAQKKHHPLNTLKLDGFNSLLLCILKENNLIAFNELMNDYKNHLDYEIEKKVIMGTYISSIVSKKATFDVIKIAMGYFRGTNYLHDLLPSLKNPNFIDIIIGLKGIHFYRDLVDQSYLNRKLYSLILMVKLNRDLSKHQKWRTIDKVRLLLSRGASFNEELDYSSAYQELIDLIRIESQSSRHEEDHLYFKFINEIYLLFRHGYL